MGWLVLGLVVGLVVGAGAVAAVLRSVGRITGTTPRGVLRLVLDGLLPGARKDGVAAQRALARRLKRTGSRTASGRRVAADLLTVHVSPEDHDLIEATLGLDAAQGDLEEFYAAHASRQSWIVGATPVVRLERDISLRPRQAFVHAVTTGPKTLQAGAGRPAPRPTTAAEPEPRPREEDAWAEPEARPQDEDAWAEPEGHDAPPDEAVTDVLPRSLLPEDETVTAVYPPGALVGDLVVVHGTDVRTVAASVGVLRVGRGAHNDIVLSRPGVARDHLVVEVRDGGWWVVPGGVLKLDGARVEQPVPLNGSGSIELGRGVRLRLTVEGG